MKIKKEMEKTLRSPSKNSRQHRKRAAIAWQRTKDAMVEGKHTVIQKDRTKNKTSHRSLPLVAPFEALLIAMKRQQKENQILCGNCYNTDYLDYIYVDPIGNLIKPDYITRHFQLILSKFRNGWVIAT